MRRSHFKDLKNLKKSLVDPISSIKRFVPGYVERFQSKVRHLAFLPVDNQWSGTLSNITIANLTLNLTTVGTGTYDSNQLTDTTIASDLKKDVALVKLIFNHTLNNGTIRYFVSNDGGLNYPVEVTVSDAFYKMPSPDDSLDNFQGSFNNLKVRIIMSGTNPVVTSLKVFYSPK